jgi:hypothetical protein
MAQEKSRTGALRLGRTRPGYGRRRIGHPGFHPSARVPSVSLPVLPLSCDDRVG